MMVDLSDEGRELVVAKSLMIADYIGLKELPDFLDRYGIIDAESLRKNLRDSVEDIEKVDLLGLFLKVLMLCSALLCLMNL